MIYKSVIDQKFSCAPVADYTNFRTNKSGKIGNVVPRSVQQRQNLRSVPLHNLTLQSGDKSGLLTVPILKSCILKPL